MLDERTRRLWAAAEARALGYGGIGLVAAATGLAHNTIRQGLEELQRQESNPATKVPVEEDQRVCGRPVVERDRVRRPGGGAKFAEVKDPGILAALDSLPSDEVAGDPMSEQRWVRSSLRNLSSRLKEAGHEVSPGTVSRLLKALGLSLKTTKRTVLRKNCPGREEQFRYIAAPRGAFTAAGLPVASVDTKKKELIGDFRNSGQSWCRKAPEVDEHDYPSAAECQAVPLGVYDVARNTGYVVVGTSNNTPEFAANSTVRWWEAEGRANYPAAEQLLIRADGGGGNGSRSRVWKWKLQAELCDRLGLTVTVCHYPPGCSKWNPVEHRLFSYSSVNWAGNRPGWPASPTCTHNRPWCAADPAWACTRTGVSSLWITRDGCTRPFNNSHSGRSRAALCANQSHIVLRDRVTPKRALMRSQRYSGRWSQNVLTIGCVSSPGPARPRAIGEGRREAVRNVETIGGTGIGTVVAVSFNSAAANAVVAVFGVVGAAGVPACRRFSQQGQA